MYCSRDLLSSRAQNPRQIAPTQLWESIPEGSRKQVLTDLSRIAAQQIVSPPLNKDVSDDNC